MNQIQKSENAVIFDNVFYDFSTGQLRSPIQTQNYVIVQVTESYYRNGFQVGKHFQYCDLEITYPLTNGLSCATNGLWLSVDKHGGYLSFASEEHALTGPKGSRFQTLAVNLKEGPCRSLLKEIKERFQTLRTRKQPELAEPLSSIMAEFMTLDSRYSVVNLDSLITNVLVKLARAGTDMPKMTAISTEERLPAIINYIDSNFLNLRSLETLSVHFGYSYGHICKAFKKLYGITPVAYLLSKKMDHADTLHREGKNLSQIAEILGYSTSYNFSRAFKNLRGVSPEKYWNDRS